MAFGHEIMEQLYRELASGRQLSAKLQALLEGPLNGRNLEEAIEVSRELGRVFMVSLFMLKPYSYSRVDEMITARPETTRTTDNSICLHTPAKDKRTRREEVPVRRVREEHVTRSEITPSPYRDGYQWKKYGQKNIQNSNFSRYYYRCTFSQDRSCAAKKQVQQQDSTSDEPPVFLVTYLNEHTCQQAAPGTPTTAGSSPTATSLRESPPQVLDSTTTGAGLFGHLLLPHAVGRGGGGSDAEENAAIVTCLATVISGGAPPPLPTTTTAPSFSWTPTADGSQRSAVPSAAHSPSADESVADVMAEMEYHPYDPSTFSPVEVAADHHHPSIGHHDVHMVVDTVWPQYTRAWP